jgi:hypothetical protein
MLTLLSLGGPTKLSKIFLIEDFFHLPPMSTTPVQISKKFETVLMGYSGAGGILIYEKIQKQKIS